VIDALNRHEKIALQFSGGKDSLALLLMMKPYWNRLSVYHLDTGDEHPDTTKIVRLMGERVPITIIQSNVRGIKQAYGLPADVVPWTSSTHAHMCNAGKTLLLQSRVACCYRTTMLPLHGRMKEDGITLIIRGQKNSDPMKGALQSGDTLDGFEFLYPLQDMTDADCERIIAEHDVEVPAYYAEGMISSGDCLGCTAWNEEHRAVHLAKNFPDRYATYRVEMLQIADAVQQSADHLFNEANFCVQHS
jgi:phosphoadenosine phosphosulfate reductase